MNDMPSIDGEQYLRDMEERLEKELTEVDRACLENLDRAIWEKVEEDLSGYIAMMTDRLVNRIFAKQEQLKLEIEELLQ